MTIKGGLFGRGMRGRDREKEECGRKEVNMIKVHFYIVKTA
jgi:hypothetical protein